MNRTRLVVTTVAPALVFAFLTLVLLLSSGSHAWAEESNPKGEDVVKLTSYEPNLLGWTYDQSGHGYMDFLLSVKFAVLPRWIEKHASKNSRVYFSFSGRFGQYFDRQSSPVIGKRFNPELFYRNVLRPKAEGNNARADDEYGAVDVGYGHESNGQRIGSLASYQQAQATLERPEYADDYISRGWDYVRLAVRSRYYPGLGTGDRMRAYFSFRRFLAGGVFQGAPEEYNSWENSPEGKPREQVDGLRVLLKYVRDSGDSERFLSASKLTLGYTTGYREIFRYNTVRLEAGVKILQLPVIIWTSRGYNSDLIRYYKYTTASGIAIEIGSF